LFGSCSKLSAAADISYKDHLEKLAFSSLVSRSLGVTSSTIQRDTTSSVPTGLDSRVPCLILDVVGALIEDWKSSVVLAALSTPFIPTTTKKSASCVVHESFPKVELTLSQGMD